MIYETLSHIALTEFDDIIISRQLIYRRATTPIKLRLFVRDETFIDVGFSPNLMRYSYHWEQRAVRGLLHRHDNAPDHPHIPTFPKHFHNGTEDAVESSAISDDPETALREFLQFVRSQLNTSSA